MDVSSAAGQVVATFTQMDAEGVGKARTELEETIRCLGEILPRPDAAAVYRADALAAYLEDAPQRVIADFRSAAQLQPSYKLSLAVAPEGHPLRGYYDSAQALGPGGDEMLPAGLVAYADGVRAWVRPLERPVILQFMDSSGQVRSSIMLRPGDPLEAVIPWELVPDDATSSTDLALQGQASSAAPTSGTDSAAPSLRSPLLVGAGVSAVGAIVAFSVANIALSNFNDPQTTDITQLESYRKTTNSGVAISGVLGLAAVGCGVSAFLVGTW